MTLRSAMTLNNIEECSLRLNTVMDCNMYNRITVENVSLPKAVLIAVKIFAVFVYNSYLCETPIFKEFRYLH